MITREVLDALFIALNTALNKGLTMGWNDWEKWCMTVTSTTGAERYPMTMVNGTMRKWIGERVINKLDVAKLTVVNEDFERTEAVNRNDVDDDNIGIYLPLFEAMGVDGINHWGRLATNALLKPGKWADGKDFFSANRKFGKAKDAQVYNNVVSGELNATNYDLARSQMLGFMDVAGKNRLGLVPNLIVVGEKLRRTAQKLFDAELTAEGGVALDNLYRSEVEIQVNPYIAGEEWFLMCTNRGIQAISVQKRKVGELQRWDQEHDVNVKNENENHYGLHYRGAAAAVCPFLVIGGNLG